MQAAVSAPRHPLRSQSPWRLRGVRQILASGRIQRLQHGARARPYELAPSSSTFSNAAYSLEEVETKEAIARFSPAKAAIDLERAYQARGTDEDDGSQQSDHNAVENNHLFR